MAGDWIKMRCDLDEDPAVIGISERTGLDIDTVIGKLFRFWRWANRQLRDGCANVALMFVDRYVGAQHFANAMVEVGWLEVVGDSGLRIPNFDRHNSKSAKTRALASERMSRKRCADVAQMLRLEKRREEKSIEKKNSKKKNVFQKPTVEDVRTHCAEKGYGFDPESFVAFYESKGWMVGSNKMAKWQGACLTWQKKWVAENTPKAFKQRVLTDEEMDALNREAL